MNKCYKLRAFTLMEVLVIVGILGILSTTSVLAMQALRQEREVKTVADKVSGIITQARSYAMAAPTTLARSGKEFIEVNLDSSTSPATVSFYYCPDTTGVGCDVISPALVNDTSIPNKVYFANSSNRSQKQSYRAFIFTDTMTPSPAGTPYQIGNMSVLPNPSTADSYNQITITDGKTSYQLFTTTAGNIEVKLLQ